MNAEPNKSTDLVKQNNRSQEDCEHFDHRHADGLAFSWIRSIQNKQRDKIEDQSGQ